MRTGGLSLFPRSVSPKRNFARVEDATELLNVFLSAHVIRVVREEFQRVESVLF